MTTLNELRALACSDCPAQVTAQVGRALDDSLVMTVVVEHADSCPWAAANVPVGGATLVKPGAVLRHCRAGDDRDVPPL